MRNPMELCSRSAPRFPRTRNGLLLVVFPLDVLCHCTDGQLRPGGVTAGQGRANAGCGWAEGDPLWADKHTARPEWRCAPGVAPASFPRLDTLTACVPTAAPLCKAYRAGHLTIRLALGGCTNRPFYRIVAAHNKCPRDGRFVEQLGSYDPLPNSHGEKLVALNLDRIRHWIGCGAHLSKPVEKLLGKLGTGLGAHRGGWTVRSALQATGTKWEPGLCSELPLVWSPL